MVHPRLLVAGALALVACGAIAFVPPPGRADDVPDAKTLRARMTAAAGPQPASVRETIVGTGMLGETRRINYRRGGTDLRTIVERSPIHTEYGTLQGESWHQNENGITVFEEPSPGIAPAETVTTTVTHVSSPVDAYVIAELNSRKQGSREYVDPKTFLSLRREVLGPLGTVTTTYDAYARFGEQLLPSRWTTSTAKGATMKYQRTEFAVGAVTDADLAIPPIRRELVTFPAGSVREDVPVTMRDGRMYVHVTIGTRTLDFLLDSGSSSIAIEAATAHDLGLATVNRTALIGAAEVDTFDTVIPSMKIGRLAMSDTVATILPRPLDKQPGLVKVVGVLGFDFLATLGVIVDYEGGHVTAARFGSFSPPQGPYVLALPVRLSDQVPMTTAGFDGAMGEHVILDTGFDGSFILFDTFLRRYPALQSTTAATSFSVASVSGSVVAQEYAVKELALGKIRFPAINGFGTTNPSSFPGSSDGLIGYDLLGLFTITFDYPEGSVFLVPNKRGQKALGLTR